LRDVKEIGYGNGSFKEEEDEDHSLSPLLFIS